MKDVQRQQRPGNTSKKKATNSTDHGVNFFMVERLQEMSSKKWFYIGT